ncbi:MAG: serine hydrolase [Elusimicrobia bacterium]|nr:serine hydrolase [Elusimicrobiota bacterium]MDE2512120.1 serine hydrolase [Elusimicrobiota bacterium]
MHRIIVDRKIRWEALRAQGADLLLFSALVVVGLSYAIGYRLDWSEENGRPEDDQEVAEIPAPASAMPAALPPLTAPVMAPAAPAAATMSAPPMPAMRPDPKDAAWDKMVAQLEVMVARYPGRVSVYIKDLRSGRTWTHNPDDLFPAASLIKVPILIATFYKIKEGGLSLDEYLTITRLNRAGGSGSLKWRPDGTKLTLRDTLMHMINESDNTATKMVLERLGLGYVQQQFPRMGLLYTGIYEEGMSLKGGRVAHENYTTAREMEMLEEKIYRGEAVDKPSSELMMEILKKPKPVAARLAKGMPAGWEIAHKTGLLRQACHDAAIFLTPNGDYAVTVLTGQNASYSQAKNFMTALAHVTFQNYAGPTYLAKATRRRRRR